MRAHRSANVWKSREPAETRAALRWQAASFILIASMLFWVHLAISYPEQKQSYAQRMEWSRLPDEEKTPEAYEALAGEVASGFIEWVLDPADTLHFEYLYFNGVVLLGVTLCANLLCPRPVPAYCRRRRRRPPARDDSRDC